MTLEEFEKAYPVIIELPIHWGDMDAFQHVNNVMYFRYFESARIAYMAETKIMDEMKSKQIGPILASTECRYRRPVTYPDTLKIGCRTVEMGEQDFIQEYAIFSESQQTITTYGKARIVMVDYKTQQKTAVSDSIRQAINKHEPKPLV
ncbi:acyl-CoA thioesterase [Pleionea mediterranea]|uniref:Acyl-CoA thioester hydrolase n=1 Tax=Pleionea mediterranea TaxID=523701 RepID=A0A316FU09_9GAMM|nr:acyl-CoA thioesterase [Pleionea mediterranea]PWK51853.1 acyl-CoA thioester hydrolase [Pleionea mediterranea]